MNNHTTNVSKMIILANFISHILVRSNNAVIDENMYVNDFLTYANKYKYSNYPVINRKGEVLGVLRASDVEDKKRSALCFSTGSVVLLII